jgi:hypothetical protein
VKLYLMQVSRVDDIKGIEELARASALALPWWARLDQDVVAPGKGRQNVVVAADEDAWRWGLRSEIFDVTKAILARKIDVDDHQIRAVRSSCSDRLGCRCRNGADIMTHLGQHVAQQQADDWLVFDDKNIESHQLFSPLWPRIKHLLKREFHGIAPGDTIGIYP